jgi:hypothetical protein
VGTVAASNLPYGILYLRGIFSAYFGRLQFAFRYDSSV